MFFLYELKANAGGKAIVLEDPAPLFVRPHDIFELFKVNEIAFEHGFDLVPGPVLDLPCE